MAETFAMQADARRAEDPESQLGPLPDVVRRQCARRYHRPDSIHAALYPHRKKPFPGTNSIRWIFAAKTTASGLIALLVAFTFNLDEPYWALLTVFIVSQPLQSGQVLAKSLYRIIGD
jgi:Fusaric acid resistance protein family